MILTFCIIHRYKLPRVLAFTAESFDSTAISAFAQLYAMRTYVEHANQDDKFFAELLGSSVGLQRHTHLVVFTGKLQEDSLVVPSSSTGKRLMGPSHFQITAKEYLWMHKNIAPFGEQIPLQCPACGRIMSLHIQGKPKQGLQETKSVIVCEGSDCKYSKVILAPKGLSLPNVRDAGQWGVMTRDT